MNVGVVRSAFAFAIANVAVLAQSGAIFLNNSAEPCLLQMDLVQGAKEFTAMVAGPGQDNKYFTNADMNLFASKMPPGLLRPQLAAGENYFTVIVPAKGGVLHLKPLATTNTCSYGFRICDSSKKAIIPEDMCYVFVPKDHAEHWSKPSKTGRSAGPKHILVYDGELVMHLEDRPLDGKSAAPAASGGASGAAAAAAKK